MSDDERLDPLDGAINGDVLGALAQSGGRRVRKRKRAWEKKAPSPYSFRPPSHDIRDEITGGVGELAKKYAVNQGEMATWLMLQAIELARKGEIEPERTFDPSRAPYTLFPDEE